MTQSVAGGLNRLEVRAGGASLFRVLIVAIAVLGIGLLATAPAEANTLTTTSTVVAGDVMVKSRAQISEGICCGYSNGRAAIYQQTLWPYWYGYNSPPGYIADQVQLWYWQVPYVNPFLCAWLPWDYNPQTAISHTVDTYWWAPCGSGGTSTYYTYNGGGRWIGYWLMSWAFTSGHGLG